jgi:PAS domain S-box-containing protein
MKRQAPCEFCKIKKAIGTGKTQKVELTSPDGKNYELTSTPFKDTDGKTKVIEIVRDVTKRKEREQECKNLINGMNDTAFVINFEGKFVEVNETAVEVLGYSREELLDMGPADIDPVLSAEDIEHLIGGMKKGEKQVFVTAHRTKSGEEIPVEVSSSLVAYKGYPAILSIARDITERKKVEEALRESEERFQTVIENLPDEIFVHDLDGKFILVNKTSCKKTGYTKDELLSMRVSDIDHESTSRGDRKNIWLKLQKKGGFARIEAIHYRKDGSTYPAEICLGTVTLKGNPMIVGIAHDITTRKKTLEELKESEERFQTVIENLPHGVCLHDLDGYMTLVNKALCGLTGYSEEELLNMNVQHVDHKSISRDDRHNLWLKLNKGGHDYIESTLHRKDGSTFPGIIYLNAIDLKGKRMILAITQDITERKNALNKLRKNEEKYRKLYESMRDAYVRTDMKGRIVEFNKHFSEMLGYTPDEIRGLKWTDITPEKWHEAENIIKEKEMLERGYTDVYEKEYIRKDGTVFPAELRGFLIKNEEGVPTGMWAIVRDISERKKTEEEFRKMERLESLGVLAGGIAHDFNNLLTGILGNLSLVQMEEGEELKNILEEATQASIQAKNLTQQLLTFSKGGEPIKGKACIEDIIRDSAKFTLHGSNVSCEYHFANDLRKVEIDKGQFSQVIDNLVINANQSMPEGGKILIKAENTILDEKNSLPLPKGKYIKITFRDEGIGIPGEYLPKIFDPYFSTKRQGSGLGLATVYSVIQKHGGYITVESKVGKGTSFFIYLPAIEEKEVEKEEKKERKKALTGEGKILIMDDEKIVRRAVTGMLKKLGYIVECAENGEEAISKYKEAMNSGGLFDVVILDLTVSDGMGGKKTIEKLLRIDPDVKAIVSSGYSTDPVMANYEKYGFRAVVAKPFDLKELSEAIKKVLR